MTSPMGQIDRLYRLVHDLRRDINALEQRVQTLEKHGRESRVREQPARAVLSWLPRWLHTSRSREIMALAHDVEFMQWELAAHKHDVNRLFTAFDHVFGTKMPRKTPERGK